MYVARLKVNAGKEFILNRICFRSFCFLEWLYYWLLALRQDLGENNHFGEKCNKTTKKQRDFARNSQNHVDKSAGSIIM